MVILEVTQWSEKYRSLLAINPEEEITSHVLLVPLLFSKLAGAVPFKITVLYFKIKLLFGHAWRN